LGGGPLDAVSICDRIFMMLTGLRHAKQGAPRNDPRNQRLSHRSR